MSHDRNLGYLHKRRIVYRRHPITDKPSESFEWGNFYKDGTYQCYELFRSNAKITTYKSLKWHLLVLYYLNPDMDQQEFEGLARFLADKYNGFITFSINEGHLKDMIKEVDMYDIDTPPKNKMRKIIFNEFSGLSLDEKMRIVGHMVGRGKKINQEDIYDCMLELNREGKYITINKLATILTCSTRTIYRNMGEELKQEKEILNKQINEKI